MKKEKDLKYLRESGEKGKTVGQKQKKNKGKDGFKLSIWLKMFVSDHSRG